MFVLPAPAKINLYLHITGKRADGYHALDTVFQLIDLQDTVKLQVRQDGQIVLHTPIKGLSDAQHLAMRAARLLQHYTRCSLGADIWVQKHIPSGAGLGGGSSDAATVLMGLNQLWGCGLSSQVLQDLGLQLGADVPFFCSGYGTAHALGIGEQLTALRTVPKAYIVVYPNCHVATPTVFKHPDLRWSVDQGLSRRTQFAENTLQDAFAAGLKNDLQTPAQAIAPPIQAAAQWLSTASTAQGVRMSGSGSAVFAQFANQADAEHALRVLNQNELDPVNPRNQWQVFVVNTLPSHPSLDFFSNSV